MKLSLVIVALLVVGAGIYVFLNGPSQRENITDAVIEDGQVNEMQDESEDRDVATYDQVGTIDDILAQGTSVSCEFYSENVIDGIVNTYSGVIYYDQDRMRVDAVSALDSELTSLEDVKVDLIVSGDVAYSWTEFGATQIDLTSAESDTVADDHVALLEDTINYDCEPWSVDESVFVLPEGVEFLDVNQMMNQNLDSLEGTDFNLEEYNLQLE